MTPAPQSPSTLLPSSQATAPEAGTAVVTARLLTGQSREALSVAEKAVDSGCLQPNAELLDRIRGEYLDMPGLKLTLPQAQRLWHLRERECEALLGALIDAKFLWRRSDGRFARVSELGGYRQTSAHGQDAPGTAGVSNDARSRTLTPNVQSSVQPNQHSGAIVSTSRVELMSIRADVSRTESRHRE